MTELQEVIDCVQETARKTSWKSMLLGASFVLLVWIMLSLKIDYPWEADEQEIRNAIHQVESRVAIWDDRGERWNAQLQNLDDSVQRIERMLEDISCE